MLLSTLFFVLSASLALADVSHDDGKTAISDSQSRKEDLRDMSLKEICYRNLYADVDAFTVKHSTEALISDTHGKAVFLSDGIKKAFDDVEYYYEEFCYKKVKARKRSDDVSKHSGLLVGRQLGVPVTQGGLSSSFGDDVGGVPHSSADSILADRSTGLNADGDQLTADGKTGASSSPVILRLKARQVDSTQLGAGKGVERRSPGWIVRVLRIVSGQWDGHDDGDEGAGGEGEGCEEGQEERGVDDGPQGGLLFE
ncbi:uncharacterized protein RHOBADRAFT_42345 [Rhodotorula graminis WP1]|uniref:Uncharacterized protein n=1 Tax=Rhodotorula graminis (strain WP1) TaxID=578459 RepID=A0A194S9J4_RHOGW|nr:uncharacterized protein RHOBADRAFT_42345 [Rhodotorula graminis WP1]KPV77135.1 hypothetical protein RHOBADRAFT_42345 [Rhodotorula graminis WP1]